MVGSVIPAGLFCGSLTIAAGPSTVSGAERQQTRVQFNLDGYRLGEVVAYHVTRANRHVAAAAQFDAGAMHMPVDLQTA
jgi:hypothetical protein